MTETRPSALPAPPPELEVRWEGERARLHLPVWPPDPTPLRWLLFEAGLLWLLTLPSVLPAAMLLTYLDPSWPLRGTLVGLTVLSLAAWIAWICMSTWRRNASRLAVDCSTTRLRLTWSLGRLRTGGLDVPLERIRQVQARRRGGKAVPTLTLHRRDARRPVHARLPGATIEELRWIAHLIDYARDRNRAFWHEALRSADDEARRQLLQLRMRGQQRADRS